MSFDYVQAMEKTNTIYLDHAAGTSLLPEVQRNIENWALAISANPSSIHGKGRAAAKVLDQARVDVANSIGARGSEILFTSGGTEANNLALVGLAIANQSKGTHIISCGTEHPSGIEALKYLESNGFSVSYLTLDSNGDIDLDQVASLIRDETILISLMWVNNETGLIHPLKRVAEIVHARDVLVHSDGVQAVGHLAVDVNEIMVDAMSFSGHKLGTPAGIGCLYLRKGTALATMSHGGSQENNLRAGTQNLLGATALAYAMNFHQNNLTAGTRHFERLNRRLVKRLTEISSIRLNRYGNAYSPHILNCSIENVDGETLFIRLDLNNICVSNGSACSSGSQTPSHVLTALGIQKDLAQSSLRISFGLETTEDEIDQFCDTLKRIVESIQGDSAS
jgi:cysteine desulfurase